jgi:hypothetical protein
VIAEGSFNLTSDRAAFARDLQTSSGLLRKRLVLVGLLLVALTACAPSTRSLEPSSAATATPAPSSSSRATASAGLPAADPCAGAAAAYSGQTVASFATTIGAIRAMATLSIQPGRWPDLADGHPAVLCYVDGHVAMAPPPPASGTPLPTFDRAVVVVIDRQVELVMAGYRDRLPIVAP